MQTKKKIGLLVLSITLILTILNFAPQVDTVDMIAYSPMQNEVALSVTPAPAPPPSMIAYWELNENSGTTVSDSIVPYVTGNTYGNPQWVPGIAQSGLNLLANQYIDFGRPSYLYLPQVLTIEAWVNIPNPSGLHTIVMNSYNPTNIQYKFGIQDGHLYFDRQAGAPGNFVTSSASITANQWHHVVVVMNWGLRMVWFYLDGVDESIYPYNDAYTGPSGEVTIGADRSTGDPSFLLGMIDEVAIYNDMLDQSIIQEHYRKGLLGLGYLDEIPTNLPPVVAQDEYSMNQETTLTIIAPGVLANDNDPNGDSLEAELVTDCTYGDLMLNPDGSFVYTPMDRWSGIDTFEYRAFDGTEYSNPTLVVITILLTDTPPVSVDDSYTTDEDVPLSVASPGVLSNDHDPDSLDTVTANLDTSTTNGELLFNSDGSFVYTPNSDWSGVDSFSYTPYDGQLYGSSTTVTITVNSVNDAPVATSDSYVGDEDIVLLGSVLDNDFDVDGDNLVAYLVSGPSHGALTLDGDTGTFTYQPYLNWFGFDSFSYYAYDGQVYSNEVTVTISINSVNDAPVVNDDYFTGYEDTVVSGFLLVNDFDVEWDNKVVFLVTDPLHGVVTIDPDTGAFTYQPNSDWFGIDTFTYNVYDGHMFSDTATVTLTINGVNDAPIAVNDTYTVNEGLLLEVPVSISVLANDSDIDGDVLIVELVDGPAIGTFTLNADGSFTYLVDGWSGQVIFTYRVFDGELYSNVASVAINVIGDDDETGPEITIIYTGVASDAAPGIWTITVVDLESGVDSIFVMIDGILVGTMEGIYTVPNSLGDHTISVTATNADTNNGPYDQESSTLMHTVTIIDDDITAPSISITYTGDMLDTNPGYWSIVVVDLESGIYSILVEIDGVPVGTSEGDYDVPSSLGFHSITVTATNNDMDRASDQETISHSAVVFIEQEISSSEIVYTGDISGVYSDPVYLEALLLDATTQLPIEGKMIQFTLGSQTAVAVTNVDGLASATIILDQEAGIYLVSVSFAGDDDYLESSNLVEFMIYRECASTIFSGLTILEVSEESITFTSTVFDDADGYWGDITRIYVIFTIYLASDPLTPIYVSYPVRVQTTDVIGVGIATLEIPNLPEGVYLAVVSLLSEHNRFFCSPDSAPVTITIYEPERSHAHGAGMIVDADGHRGHFVFKAQYTCKGKLQGFLLYSYVEGDLVFLVKSCDIIGFTTDGNHGFFEANSTISIYNFKTHEKIGLDGWYRVRVDVFDNKKNHEKDVFQLRVFDSLGEVEYEAGFEPFGYLLRGCIVVKHGRGGKGH